MNFDVRLETAPSKESIQAALETLLSSLGPGPEGEVLSSFSSDQIEEMMETWDTLDVDWIFPSSVVTPFVQTVSQQLGRLEFPREFVDTMEDRVQELLMGLFFDIPRAQAVSWLSIFETLNESYRDLLFSAQVSSRDFPRPQRPLSEEEREKFLFQTVAFLRSAGLDPEQYVWEDPVGSLLPWMQILPEYLDRWIFEFTSSLMSLWQEMAWVPLGTSSEISISDRPRALTSKEIQQILEAVPGIFSASQRTSEMARNSLQHDLRNRLERIEICPSALPALEEEIRLQFETSRAEPGAPVGMTVADGIGETATQATLNTFHHSGQAKNMSSGIRALNELITASHRRQFPSCTVVFREQFTIQEILDLKGWILETTVADLILEDRYVIEDIRTLGTFWWHSFYELVPTEGEILRLTLDVVKMTERHITMEKVVEALRKANVPYAMNFAHSPTEEGILDMYPNLTIIRDAVIQLRETLKTPEEKSLRDEFVTTLFLEHNVRPQLPLIRIQGVSGIHDFFVVKTPLWKIVLSERRPSALELESWGLPSDPTVSRWVLFLDQRMIRISPVQPSMLQKLLEKLDFERELETPDFWVVRSGPSLDPALSPKRVQDQRIEQAKKAQDEEFFRSVEYYYVDTLGCNMKELLGRRNVDPAYTFSNNIHEIQSTLGVEAAEQFFMKELYDVVRNSGGYINPRHILLLADYLFSRGDYRGATYPGMSSGVSGYLSLATVERPMQTLAREAVFSGKEDIQGISASVAVGAPIRAGTGFFEVLSSEEKKLIQAPKISVREEEIAALRNEIQGRENALLPEPVFAEDALDSLMEFQRRPILPVGISEEGRIEEIIPEAGIPAPPSFVLAPPLSPISEGLKEAVQSVDLGRPPEDTTEEERQIRQEVLPEIPPEDIPLEIPEEEVLLPPEGSTIPNPNTGRFIQVGGPTYVRLVHEGVIRDPRYLGKPTPKRQAPKKKKTTTRRKKGKERIS